MKLETQGDRRCFHPSILAFMPARFRARRSMPFSISLALLCCCHLQEQYSLRHRYGAPLLPCTSHTLLPVSLATSFTTRDLSRTCISNPTTPTHGDKQVELPAAIDYQFIIPRPLGIHHLSSNHGHHVALSIIQPRPFSGVLVASHHSSSAARCWWVALPKHTSLLVPCTF